VVALTAWIAFQNLSAKFNSALGAEENGLCKLSSPTQWIADPDKIQALEKKRQRAKLI
jgi:hypothetical protein